MTQKEKETKLGERIYWVLVSALINVTIAGAIVLVLRWPTPAAIVIETPYTENDQEGLLPVYVTGAVSNPGVYWLPFDSIASDALAAAGGPSENADLVSVNLALRLMDGSHLHVPYQGERDVVTLEDATESSDVLNINTASAEELESLPGIGPALAERIVLYREENGHFSDIEELMNVSGIGEKILDRIRPYVVVR